MGSAICQERGKGEAFQPPLLCVPHRPRRSWKPPRSDSAQQTWARPSGTIHLPYPSTSAITQTESQIVTSRLPSRYLCPSSRSLRHRGLDGRPLANEEVVPGDWRSQRDGYFAVSEGQKVPKKPPERMARRKHRSGSRSFSRGRKSRHLAG